MSGGHDIPEAKIRERYPAALNNLIALLTSIAHLRVYDNNTEVAPMTRLVSGIIIDGCAPKDPVMLIDHSREKLLNAINFFARHTENLGKIKLFKLLYLLDFEHFRQTGRSVTGLEYRAWEFGPVPILLMQEWEQPEPDFLESLRIEPEPVFDHVRHSVRPLAEFDDRHFSRRELRLLEHFANEFRDALSQPIIDATHPEGLPWVKVWTEEGMNAPIPYDLAVDEGAPDAEAALDAAREYEAMGAKARSFAMLPTATTG